MKKIYSLVTAFLISMLGFSQDTASTNKDLYKTTIYSATLFNKNKILARDYLVQVTDSTVSLSSKPLPFYLPDTATVLSGILVILISSPLISEGKEVLAEGL